MFQARNFFPKLYYWHYCNWSRDLNTFYAVQNLIKKILTLKPQEARKGTVLYCACHIGRQIHVSDCQKTNVCSTTVPFRVSCSKSGSG